MKYIYQPVLWFAVFCVNMAAAQDLSFVAPQAPLLTCFFGTLDPDTPEFSALGTLEFLDNAGVPQFTLPMELSVSTNKLRWQIDVMKVRPLSQQMQNASKMMHTDKMILLTRLDQKMEYMIYPGIQAYVPLPIPDSALAELGIDNHSIKIERTELAHETIYGHSCIKTKAVLSAPNRPTEEGILWCATDLRKFAVRMELRVATGTMKFDFPEVKMEQPIHSLFEVPSNYLAFTNAIGIIHYARERFQSNPDSTPK